MKHEKVKKDVGKKPLYRKWWFWIAIALLLIAIFSSGDKHSTTTPGAAQTPNQSEATDPQPTDNSPDSVELPSKAETVCRALTNLFIENVVSEKWHMLAFSIESYALDENQDGTINVLYLPPKAGNGETKVNLTIEKKADTYTISYALLAGINEVDLSKISNKYKTLTD